MSDHEWPYGEPIVVVLEGGLVQGVYSPTASARPVIIIDYGDDAIDSINAHAVPQPEGAPVTAWVNDYGIDALNPVITDFIHDFLNGAI